MKLKVILSGIIIILMAGILFYPVTQNESITVDRPLFDVYNQLHHTESWARWYPFLNGELDVEQLDGKRRFTIVTPSKSVCVTFLDSFIFSVEDGTFSYKIILSPQKYDKATGIIVSFRSNLFLKLMRSQHRQQQLLVNKLKKSFENSVLYYGVDIKRQTMAGMDMAVLKTLTKPADQFSEIAKSVKMIKSLLTVDELTNDSVYIQITSIDSMLEMFVGVSLKKKFPLNKRLAYMHIPPQQLLFVNYNGPFSNKQKTYTGVEAYMQDHVLRSVMKPIEIYNSNNLPLSDTDQVNMQIMFSAY